MRDHAFYRAFANRCRELLKLAANPEVVAQLQEWAVEFDRLADRSLRVATPQETDLIEQARRHRMKAEEYRVVCGQLHDPEARAVFQRLAETYDAMARRLERYAETNKPREVAS